MGYLAAVKRFLDVMAMVWAGSQITKLVRAGGALALAPTVDRILSRFTVKFKFDSRVKRNVHCRIISSKLAASGSSLMHSGNLFSSWTARDTHGWDAKHYAGISFA